MSAKYPRTAHLPWSPGRTNDDVGLSDLAGFTGSVVLTEKRDGENTTMTRDVCHARSVDSLHHPSRTWVKSLWGSIRSDIPENFRVCGENLYATHSIHYTDLPSYFEMFSFWKDDVCLSWEETISWAELLGLRMVPVLYEGPMLPAAELHRLWQERTPAGSEGYVVRIAGSFPREEFPVRVGKYVRENHVTTETHWMSAAVVPNELRS